MLEPGKIERGEDYGPDFTGLVEHGIAEINRGLSRDAADLVFPDGEVTVGHRGLEVRPVGDIDGLLERQRAAEDIAVSVRHAEIGVVGILLQQRGQESTADNAVRFVHLRDLGEDLQKLVGILEYLLLGAGGEGDDLLCAIQGIRFRLLTHLEAGVKNEGQRRGGCQQYQDDQACPQAREERLFHGLAASDGRRVIHDRSM